MRFKKGDKVVLKKLNQYGKPLLNAGKVATIDYATTTKDGYNRVIISSTGKEQSVTTKNLRRK